MSHDDLYDPDLAKVSVRELAERAHPVLRRIIEEGTQILKRCSYTAERGDENLAVFLPFHHFLEMLDAVNELAALGRSTGAIPALRSAFEALLTIEYVLREDSERRSAAWFVGHLHNQLRFLERLTPGSSVRRQLDRALAEDEWLKRHHLPAATPEAIAEKKARLAAALDDPQWKSAADAWEVAKRKKRGRRPEWYELFDGPSNRKELARAVGRAYCYELLYRVWSATAHVADPGRIFKMSRGQPAFTKIPYAGQVDTVFSFAIGFGLAATRTVVVHYRGEEEWWANWYKQEIQAAYREIAS